jgi:hypothetical protein
MLTNLKALIVILGIAVPILWLAKDLLIRAGLSAQDYDRRRTLFIAVTVLAFIAPDFWIFIGGSGLLLLTVGRRDSNPIALFCFLLFAAPPFGAAIPGFGIVNILFDMSYYRLLILVVLVPLALWIYKSRKEAKNTWRVPDVLLASLVIWMLIARAMNTDSVTAGMRNAFDLFVDIWIPYYVASRALRSEKDFSDVIASLVLSIGIIAVIGFFESARSWLLYEHLSNSWGLPPGPFAQFQMRGILRAKATPFDSIALGFTFMIALTLLFYIGPRLGSKKAVWVTALALICGLIVTVSRGPWVGTLAAALVATVIGPGAFSRAMLFAVGAGAVVAMLLVSPFGDTLVSYLPFVGSVDASTVDFRGQLIDVSLEVLKKNLIFGNVNYTSDPLMQQMVQGHDFIDVVNTYVQYALPYGLLGLLLFVFSFATASVSLLKAHKRHQATNPDLERLGRSLIAVIAGIAVTIATVSSISVVPTMYWLILGIAVSYARAFGSAKIVATSRAKPGRKPNAVRYRDHYS